MFLWHLKPRTIWVEVATSLKSIEPKFLTSLLAENQPVDSPCFMPDPHSYRDDISVDNTLTEQSQRYPPRFSALRLT